MTGSFSHSIQGEHIGKRNRSKISWHRHVYKIYDNVDTNPRLNLPRIWCQGKAGVKITDVWHMSDWPLTLYNFSWLHFLLRVLVDSARRLGNKIQKKIEYKRCIEFNDYSFKILMLVMISAKDLHDYFPEATFIILECTPWWDWSSSLISSEKYCYKRLLAALLYLSFDCAKIWVKDL